MLLVEAQDVFVADLCERRLAAAHRIAVRMFPEQECLAVDRQQRIEVGVLRRANKVDRALTQFVELRLVETRPQQHVGQKLDHQAGMTREERARNRNGLEIGAAREGAAGRIDGLCKLGGVALTGTFLEQRREQVGKATVSGRIRHGAAPQDRRHRHQRDFRLVAQQQHGAVVELEAMKGRQRDALCGRAAGQEHEQQDGGANSSAGRDHSCSSSSCCSPVATGEYSIPIVALLRRKTLAATAFRSSSVMDSITFARSNSLS